MTFWKVYMHRTPQPVEDATKCGEQYGLTGFFCELERGHDGPHVASATTTIIRDGAGNWLPLNPPKTNGQETR